MKSRSDRSSGYGAEARPHPVHHWRTAYWATLYDPQVRPCGPFRTRKDALAKAKHEMGERMKAKHVPGLRVDLPGQLEMPDTAAQPAEFAKRLAAAPMRPSVPQKPCDLGLFDDTQMQIDLEEILG